MKSDGTGECGDESMNQRVYRPLLCMSPGVECVRLQCDTVSTHQLQCYTEVSKSIVKPAG